MTEERYTELEEAMRPVYAEEPNDSVRWIGWTTLDYQGLLRRAMLLKKMQDAAVWENGCLPTGPLQYCGQTER